MMARGQDRPGYRRYAGASAQRKAGTDDAGPEGAARGGAGELEGPGREPRSSRRSPPHAASATSRRTSSTTRPRTTRDCSSTGSGRSATGWTAPCWSTRRAAASGTIGVGSKAEIEDEHGERMRWRSRASAASRPTRRSAARCSERRRATRSTSMRPRARGALACSPSVFDHVTIRVSDRQASEPFYDPVLRTLGIEKTYSDERLRRVGRLLALAGGADEQARTRGCTSASWRRRATRSTSSGAPAPSAGYRERRRARPAAAVPRRLLRRLPPRPRREQRRGGPPRRDARGRRDRPPLDPGRGRRRGEAVLRDRRAATPASASSTTAPDRAQFAGESGSFSVVAGDADRARPHGVPGRRQRDRRRLPPARPGGRLPGQRRARASGRMYHEGYYGAFVLDPDGNNIELVNHNR